jgi:hypothetical protein
MPEDLALQALIAKHRPVHRERKESNLLPRLVTAAAKLGMRLWRNQVGSYKLADGRYLTSGLCVGSSDLIGYTRVVITPEMVGQTVAVFTAIEAKAPSGKATDRQVAFLERVRVDGGIAQTVRSVLDLEGVLVPFTLFLR